MHGRKKSDLPQTKEEKDAVQTKISNYKKASGPAEAHSRSSSQLQYTAQFSEQPFSSLFSKLRTTHEHVYYILQLTFWISTRMLAWRMLRSLDICIRWRLNLSHALSTGSKEVSCQLRRALQCGLSCFRKPRSRMQTGVLLLVWDLLIV